ncbi:cache domain-containing protein [Gordoniibacillus kamchatkensis]|uniref:cache domain-containing protein n=1 Tax=Gordoniibacillus kamchatkensis TaxID=1590651 RepID=UPI000697B66A|nr:cache domain-containing protein [Paenibacillus sp. VKM B-2647]
MKFILRTFKWNIRSVKSRLILSYSIILLIPSLAIGWNSYTTAKNKVDDQMKQAAAAEVALLNQTIAQMIDGKMKDVDLLSQQVSLGSIGSIQGDEDPKVNEAMDTFKRLHPELESVIAGTDQGVTVQSPRSLTIPADYDPRNKPWYTQAMAHKDKVIVTNTYISNFSNMAIVSIAKAVNDGHGVIAANLNLKTLDDMVKGVKIGERGYIYLLDANRKYLIHPIAKIGDTSTAPTTDTMFKSESGEIEYVNTLDGKPKKMVYETNPLTGWKIAGTWYSDEVRQAAAPIFRRTTMVMALALFAGAIIVFVIIRSIAIPLRSLTDTSREISEGDLERRVEVKAGDELGQLGRSFNAMVDSLRSVMLELARRNREMTDSIAYANRIQQSVLPSPASLEQVFAEHWVVWKPRDVVGGDFYWTRQVGEVRWVAVGDCTGHGVPGALMTMLTVALLNRIADQGGNDVPSQVLQKLNGLLKHMLRQEQPEGLSDDGLDLGLCFAHGAEVTFAGAGMTIYVADAAGVRMVKGDKHKIGYRSTPPDCEYTNRLLRADPDAAYYMASDGVTDQNGGDKNVSLGRTRLMAWIDSFRILSMPEQRGEFERKLADYMGSEPQRDDIAMLAFRAAPKRAS